MRERVEIIYDDEWSGFQGNINDFLKYNTGTLIDIKYHPGNETMKPSLLIIYIPVENT